MADISSLQPTDRVRVPEPGLFARHDAPDPAPAIRRGSDLVEVSDMATYLSKLRQLPVRQELVDSVREQIANGTYDTADRLEQALDELIQDL
jgi:anti-sigma28 factor (negative regulator of flagellin synthesis)